MLATRLHKGPLGFFSFIFLAFLLTYPSGMAFPGVKGEKPERTLKAHRDVVSTLAISPDGSLLASGSFDNTVKLWDIGAGILKHTLKGISKKVSSVAFSPDGKLIAGASWMLHEESKGSSHPYIGEVMIWNVQTGDLVKTLNWYSAPMWSLDFSPDGQTIAGGTGLVRKEDGKYYGQVILWDVQSGNLKQTLMAHSAPIWTVAFSPDSRYIAGGAGLDKADGTYEVLVWDIQTGKIDKELKGHTGRVISVVFSPDGTTLASIASDRTIRLWDIKTGTIKLTLTKEGEDEPGKPRAGSGPYVDRVRMDSPGLFSVLKKGWANSVAFSVDGTTLAGVGADNKTRLWDAQTGKLKKTLSGNRRGVYALAFSPDGKRLAAGNADGTINIWDIK